MSGLQRIARPAAASPDWSRLAVRARRLGALRRWSLVGFLTLVSIPILLPFFWVVVISFSARTGGVDSAVLWRACAVLVPCVLGYAAAHVLFPARQHRMVSAVVATAVAVAGLWLLVGSDLHLDNYRFLVSPNLVEEIRGAATAGGQFPWVWNAFFNSLAVAATSMAAKVTIATLAGYYLSRFAFRGRSLFLQSLLILEVFHPWMLTIPIFLVIFWVGLLNTLSAPILVLTVIDLPFFIFIMKGFFDAVPWDIEMSAMTDGATRRQAFWHVVLPQAYGGIIAISVLGFIRGWEEYVFVTALRTGNSYWVMSTYLYYVAEDVMGVDYGLVAAVSVFYMLPSLLLYLFLQKYLTQLTLGGVKG
ncbi:carbohydrate ABC transporter permease [Rhodobacterales bacterium]|nr:carbohydrate ABC transporter permease [Rhodobacterales bacterium]